jgi:hypothetical protein
MISVLPARQAPGFGEDTYPKRCPHGTGRSGMPPRRRYLWPECSLAGPEEGGWIQPGPTASTACLNWGDDSGLEDEQLAHNWLSAH